MGWLWRSEPLASNETSKFDVPAPAEAATPTAAPAHNPIAEPVKQALSREEQANQEFLELVRELQAQTEVEPEQTSWPQGPRKYTQAAPVETDISPDSLYPTEISCRSAFDYAMFCQSFGGQFVNIYRYGTFRSCSNHWDDFWLCMRTRNWDAKDRSRAIQEHYRKKAIKWKTGPSSEDVWESKRTKRTMDSVMPQFLMNTGLSTTPQHAFEQADALLLQAADLRSEAAALQAQIDILNARANTLTTTAKGLQAIAIQDRESIQYILDGALLVFKECLTTYESRPRKAANLENVKTRVEDGMATLEEVEDILQDLQSSQMRHRSERSWTPEPETPPDSPGTLATAEDEVGIDSSKNSLTDNDPLKRKVPAELDGDEEADMDLPLKRARRASTASDNLDEEGDIDEGHLNNQFGMLDDIKGYGDDTSQPRITPDQTADHEHPKEQNSVMQSNPRFIDPTPHGSVSVRNGEPSRVSIKSTATEKCGQGSRKRSKLATSKPKSEKLRQSKREKKTKKASHADRESRSPVLAGFAGEGQRWAKSRIGDALNRVSMLEPGTYS
ncbi:hypothetical protein LTR46_004240 [Exophiala xenobiotica]|nr:hypothetical protein LTR46_004240 [Exophiala xenobiotica]